MPIKIKQASTSSESRIISGGLLAVNIAVVVQLLQISTLDYSLSVALWCASVSIPILALHYLTTNKAEELGYDWFPWYGWIVLPAWILSLTELGFIIHHFNVDAALVFGLICFGVIILYADFSSKLSEAVQNEIRKDEDRANDK